MSTSSANLPKISVVTINRNMRDGLLATVESVLCQTYPRVEFLIIDGGSADGSLEVIERYASRITYWVSEVDRGIYDAMNKGVRAATGEWVIFMNSGDRFYDRNTIADVFSQDHSDADLVYGHSTHWYANEELEKFKPAVSQAALPVRMNCSHQSLFTRRDLLLKHPFSLHFIAADYEFLVRMYTEGRRFRSVDRIVAVNRTGGISDVNRLRSVTERARIALSNGLMTPRRIISFIGEGIWAVIVPHVKRALPKQVRAWILKRKTAD